MNQFRYAEMSRHVRILWAQARYGGEIDPTYRAWITMRTTDRLFDAMLAHDDATDELRKHLAHDYRLEGQEPERFDFWWDHILDHGFDGPSPLKQLHKTSIYAQGVRK
jgi:hypothetical protein